MKSRRDTRDNNNNNTIPTSITIMSHRTMRRNKETPVYIDKNGDSYFNPDWLKENMIEGVTVSEIVLVISAVLCNVVTSKVS